MKRFMEIMNECIPQRLLPNRRNLPWLSKSLVQLMRRKNMLFSKAKRSGKRSDVEKYKRIRNRVVTQLRNAKSSYFKNLNPKHNSKKFRSAVKYLNKKHNSIPVLNHGSMTANTNEEKAEMLNSFSNCFNPPLSSNNDTTASACEVSSIDDLLCTEEDVYGLLSSLDVSKASGPDGVSARMLKMTSEFIATLLCMQAFQYLASNWSSSTGLETIYYCAYSKNFPCMYTR